MIESFQTFLPKNNIDPCFDNKNNITHWGNILWGQSEEFCNSLPYHSFQRKIKITKYLDPLLSKHIICYMSKLICNKQYFFVKNINSSQ